MKRINLLYSGRGPISDGFFNIIFPQVKDTLPLVRRKIMYLPKVKDDFPIDCEKIYSIDFRHWYYNDDIFDSYIVEIIKEKPELLFLFDSPMGYERPWKIDIKEFLKGLSRRTTKLHDELRKNVPDIRIISPWISNIHHDHRKYYTDYIIDHSSSFDAYSILCANDLSDISIGALSSDFGTIQKESSKPAYLMCAIPCGERTKNIRDLNEKPFEPLPEQQASAKLIQIRNMFSKMCKDLTTLYFGIGKDLYNPNYSPKNIQYWDNSLPLDIYLFEKKWDWIHYLGLIDSNDRIKFKLLKSIIDLAQKENV